MIQNHPFHVLSIYTLTLNTHIHNKAKFKVSETETRPWGTYYKTSCNKTINTAATIVTVTAATSTVVLLLLILILSVLLSRRR